MNTDSIRENLPAQYFFLLVFCLSIPIWLIGGNKLPIPVNLPVSSLMFVNTLIAAVILSYRQYGFIGIRELLEKTFDYKKIKNKIWYVPILFLNPFVYFLSYIIMRSAAWQLPDPIMIPVLMAPVFFLIYFIEAIFEELGWMGYAFDPLQSRWGALRASIILGIVWQIWHIIPDLQAHYTTSWILWHDLQSIALRVLIAWIYNNTGRSVFAAILVHTMDNVSWSLFPNYGSAFDPFITGMIISLMACIITVRWGSRTLTQLSSQP